MKYILFENARANSCLACYWV